MANNPSDDFNTERLRRLIDDYRGALYNFNPATLNSVIAKTFSPDCIINISNPFGTLNAPEDLVEKIFLPLSVAIPDIERRDYIVIAGATEAKDFWIGCAGYYTGVFEHAWLSIPPTGHQIAFRFHEFYKIENNLVVEVQAIWDLPELMLQANAWPMAPALGVQWLVPAPATQDGISTPANSSNAASSLRLVGKMLEGLSRSRRDGAEAMTLDKFWHPKMNWYGPAGIGTSRRISGFRYWHQIPFLKAMPDRQGSVCSGHLFADNQYVGFTGWPGMSATVTGDGWMGIAPSGQAITMRSLDFWRCETNLIRENWVLVDLLDIYQQLGIDVFARMREFTAHRQTIRPNLLTTGKSGDDVYRGDDT